MGTVAYSHVSAYAASKHGVLGLTRALALETARLGVTVNAMCPGYVDDERTRENARRMAERTGKSIEDILKIFANSSPQNRLIDPDEIAGLALLLASDKADRKSTRLNSSHTVISYAVFCLKKKTKKKTVVNPIQIKQIYTIIE